MHCDHSKLSAMMHLRLPFMEVHPMAGSLIKSILAISSEVLQQAHGSVLKRLIGWEYHPKFCLWLADRTVGSGAPRISALLHGALTSRWKDRNST